MGQPQDGCSWLILTWIIYIYDDNIYYINRFLGKCDKQNFIFEIKCGDDYGPPQSSSGHTKQPL